MTNLLPLLAQARGLPAFNWVQLAVFIIVVAAIIGIVFVAVRQSGVAIPGWFIHVVGIVICAAVCIFAVLFLASFL